MSSVATTATIQRKPVVSDFSAAAPFEQTCHKCGAELSHSHGGPGVEAGEDAQKRIEELEAQVRILTGKATAA
ncbi:hypothetical protein MMC21_002969, partial [Puttea exsequens]|nr:hypothetical protein [Puttea exsequens]